MNQDLDACARLLNWGLITIDEARLRLFTDDVALVEFVSPVPLMVVMRDD